MIHNLNILLGITAKKKHQETSVFAQLLKYYTYHPQNDYPQCDSWPCWQKINMLRDLSGNWSWSSESAGYSFLTLSEIFKSAPEEKRSSPTYCLSSRVNLPPNAVPSPSLCDTNTAMSTLPHTCKMPPNSGLCQQNMHITQDRGRGVTNVWWFNHTALNSFQW